MTIHITPNCRYGHGDLSVAPVGAEGVKLQGKWGFIGAAEPVGTVAFTGTLYVCTTCGYTEFFDDEIDKTAQQIESEK